MKYMTKELERKFPEWMSTDGLPHDQIVVQAHFFSPYSNWDWYAWEYDAECSQFFGLVFGFKVEAGYFNVQEFEEAKKGSLPLVERDLWWKPVPLNQLPRYHEWACAE